MIVSSFVLYRTGIVSRSCQALRSIVPISYQALRSSIVSTLRSSIVPVSYRITLCANLSYRYRIVIVSTPTRYFINIYRSEVFIRQLCKSESGTFDTAHLARYKSAKPLQCTASAAAGLISYEYARETSMCTGEKVI